MTSRSTGTLLFATTTLLAFVLGTGVAFAQEEVSPAQGTSAPEQDKMSPLQVGGFTLLGVGALSTTASLVYSVRINRKVRQYEERTGGVGGTTGSMSNCNDLQTESCEMASDAEYERTLEQVEKANKIISPMFYGGLGLMAGGGVMLLVHRIRPKKTALQVAPTFAPGYGGVDLHLRF